MTFRSTSCFPWIAAGVFWLAASLVLPPTGAAAQDSLFTAQDSLFTDGDSLLLGLDLDPLAAILLPGEMPAVETTTQVRSAVEMGYDRFAQTYRFTDSALLRASDGGLDLGTSLRDTVDVFTEMRAQAELRISRPWGTHRYELLGLGSLGTELRRGYLQGVYRYRPPQDQWRFDTELQMEGRFFQRGSSFQLSHDNRRGMLRLHGRRRLGENALVGVKLRTETLDYDGRSTYEYDQTRWTLGATADLRNGSGFYLDLEGGGGRRSVPDSTQISYRRGFVQGDLFLPLGGSGSLSFFTAAERRVFQDPGTRSPYWDLVFEPELRIALSENWRLRPRAPQEVLLYDIDDQVYQDTWLGQVGLELARRFSALELALEPRWTWNVSPFDTDDEFRQPSVAVSARLQGTGSLWFTFTEEIGWRNYEDPPQDSVVVYTDYRFFRTTLMASWTFLQRLSLQAFVSDEPDIHVREEDDNRLGLYSLTLRADF